MSDQALFFNPQSYSKLHKMGTNFGKIGIPGAPNLEYGLEMQCTRGNVNTPKCEQLRNININLLTILSRLRFWKELIHFCSKSSFNEKSVLYI